MRNLWKLLAVLAAGLSGLVYCASSASGERPDSLVWKAEVEASFSSGRTTPFWIVSNRQGLVSPEKNNGFVRLSLFKDMSYDSRFSWGAGADIAVPWNGTSPWIVQQLYGEVRYRCLGAMVGAKEMYSELVSPDLSSGDMLYSGNARPIPQIRLGIFDYADVWGLRGWIGVKGHLAYGAFTDQRFQKGWVDEYERRNSGVLYCSRALWIRNGNPSKFPLVFEAGIEMSTQFGGKCYNYLYRGGKTITMPKNLKAFLKALVPMKGDNSTIASEQKNVEGNMLGTWNFALSWNSPHGWMVKAYYQHFFEDHSMLYIDFPWKDGLFGLQANLPENPFVGSLVYEFLYTKDQSGPVNWDKTDKVPDQVSGADYYYSHNIYTGWSNWGFGIGSPLLLSPIFNNPHTFAFLSTRVISHHVGISGSPTSAVDWWLLLTHTRSWGSYHNPYPKVMEAFSGLAQVSWHPARLKGWEGTLGVGLDRGSLVGNNFGVMLRISKTGSFGFRKKHSSR